MRISDWSSDVCSSDLFLIDADIEPVAPVNRLEIVGQGPQLAAAFDVAAEDDVSGRIGVAEEGALVVCQREARKAENRGYHRDFVAETPESRKKPQGMGCAKPAGTAMPARRRISS